ncbi:hypothetical protein FSARC_4013 [Fusarium sarcochroum]|uniref:Zn(2)-C6 fungal-type domain-containing protein n=1 Tax=Fusarium sarcochroum TaxID=1208366 RepID=A0A8H4U2N3_9HYPO|nr:hypothetical protein FSARC_4013 [Fusarium sarcochroum]
MATSNRRPQRTSTACDFCRRRKLGCDNAKPKCENCQARAVECTYARRTAQARPSNARINKLEEENAHLRQLLRSSSSAPNSAEPSGVLQQPPNEPIRIQTVENSAPGATHANIHTQSPTTSTALAAYPNTTTGQPEHNVFHGPSSGTIEAREPRNSNPHTANAADFIVRNHLLAETTRQRQFENINHRAGKLEFGGIDTKVGMDLLSNFWNRQHYIGSAVYRPAFMRDMACHGPYFSELLLNAILFAGSKHTANSATLRSVSDLNSIGRPFRVKFEQILHGSDSQILFKSEITTIQALLVVADALFSWCNERSLSWHYMGIAISMIVDLGLHIDGPARRSSEKPTVEDTEVERRVFWAAFALDKVQSIYQGRPARLREDDNRVPIMFLDEYEELEDFSTRTYSESPTHLGCPTYSVSTFEQLCKLSTIIDRILYALYAEKSSVKNADQLWETAHLLDGRLNYWKNELPVHLQVQLNDPAASTILPHTLSLLALYNSLVILVYRPFLSEGHLASVSATAAPEAFSNCATAALEIHQILQLYKQHFCFKTAPYFISYATYVSATIHVRMAAQKRPGSQAHSCLRACLETLSVQQTQCHGPKRTMRILLSTMDRLNVSVGEFVAIDPTSCQMAGTNAINGNGPVEIETSIHDQAPNTLGLPSLVPDSDIEMPIDFQINTDLALTDFDIDQIMQSFVVEAPAPTKQIPPSYQPGGFQVGLNNDRMGDEIFLNPDMMVFDNLFGFDTG